MAGAGVVLGACLLKLRRGWATQQVDVDGNAWQTANGFVQGQESDGCSQQDFKSMVVKSPVGAAVVMGLSVSQHMMTSVSKKDEGGIFAPGGFAI